MVLTDSLMGFWNIDEKLREAVKGKIIFPGTGEPAVARNKVIMLRNHGDILPSWTRDSQNHVFIDMIFKNFTPGEPLLDGLDSSGKKFVLIQKDAQGRIIFNFNPQQAINFLLEERYLKKARPLYTHLPFGFSEIMPPFFKKMIKGNISRCCKKRSSFPDWPIEKSVELIRGIFLGCLKLQGAETEAIQSNFWPQERRFAAALTHDVDTERGFKNIEKIADIEEKKGFVSTWFMLAKGYKKDKSVLRRLLSKGHEIALHGDFHDNGLAFLSKERISARFIRCSDFIQGYGIKGFRAPSLLHSPALRGVLSDFGFYDSSIPDSGKLSPFPYPVGCCSVFPFLIDNVLEVPITLPLDSALIYSGLDSQEMLALWKKKIEWIREVGGAGVLNTHPEPHFIANKEYIDSYGLFLDELTNYRDAWVTTVATLANWWRKREKIESAVIR